MWFRQRLLALLAFIAFIYLVAGLVIVWIAPHAPLPTMDSSTSSTLGGIAGAYAEAIQQALFVLATGLPALALFWVLSWRCNVRLREDAYHQDLMRALAAIARANAPARAPTIQPVALTGSPRQLNG